MTSKLSIFTLLALNFITIHTANAAEEANTGTLVRYALGTRGDKEIIENYIAGLKTLAKENDPEKNNLYKHDLKCAQSYAKRYIATASTNQLEPRAAFLAQFNLPPYLGQSPSYLFTARDIEIWSKERPESA